MDPSQDTSQGTSQGTTHNTEALKWLFLDLNSYFASVEQQEQPHLRGRPVAVLPVASESTCAIAASYQAKAYGVKTGTKIYQARRMCPGLVCVPARHDLYVRYHHRILEAVSQILPIHKIWSIDEFDCLLLGRQTKPAAAKALAQNIKNSIARQVGVCITCSIGIGPNAFLAKVGTEMQKPDGLVLLPPEALPGALLNLKLTDLPGINVGMEQRLWRCGIRSVEALWNSSPKQARAAWGSVQGERFWCWLHGMDIPVPETRPAAVGHSRVLDPHLRHPDRARQMARRLLVKAAARLRRKGFYACRLTFSARLMNGIRFETTRRFPAARDPFTFLQHFDALWQALETAHPGPQAGLSHTLKKVSVTLDHLRRTADITGDLFDTCLQQSRAQLARRDKLSAALDRLQQRYHADVVTLGTPPKTLAGYVGTKIAFSRVPEQEEFWE